MNEIQVGESMDSHKQELLYFWALGDLHYRAIDVWQHYHSQRLATMYQDLQTLWQIEDKPAFCVSPGDLVETHKSGNHELARYEITSKLGDIPFYPGTGNHEFWDPDQSDPALAVEEFTHIWEQPLRYSWTIGNFICVMLDHPDLYRFPESSERPYFMAETLEFLETTLATHPEKKAIIFAHLPLTHTVLDRDPQRKLDYTSEDPFFAAGNSAEVRAILAKHPQGKLYLCGHTHSGWGAPRLVCTEMQGGHPVTFINLMSPWYTGRHHGLRMNAERTSAEYRADEPDIQATYSIKIYPSQSIIRIREHKTQSWLGEWEVPI